MTNINNFTLKETPEDIKFYTNIKHIDTEKLNKLRSL